MERNDIALVRRRIGVVHQDCQFIDHLSVAIISRFLICFRTRYWDDTTNLKEPVGLGRGLGKCPAP